jgi:hypothetical protein
MKISKHIAALAKKFNCGPRTIQRWKRDGAPLQDNAAMWQWLAGRKNLPPGTAAMLAKKSAAGMACSIDDAAGASTGAPAALRRLEAVEQKAFSMLVKALKTGDPVAVRNGRELWLKTGDSLRRYDLLVERSRRDTGELVPRGEVEGHLRHFIHFLRIGLTRAACRIAEESVGLSVGDMNQLVSDVFHDSVLSSLAVAAARPTPMQLPPWFIMAATTPMGDSFTDAESIVEDRRRAIEEVFQALVEANTDARASLLSELRQREAERDARDIERVQANPKPILTGEVPPVTL